MSSLLSSYGTLALFVNGTIIRLASNTYTPQYLPEQSSTMMTKHKPSKTHVKLLTYKHGFIPLVPDEQEDKDSISFSSSKYGVRVTFSMIHETTPDNRAIALLSLVSVTNQ